MSRSKMWWQVGGLVVACPMVTWSVMKLTVPKEGELFEKFNPELQKRNLEMRDQRTRDYQEYLDQLQRYSKSDKPIWVVAREEEEKKRRQKAEQDVKSRIDAQKLKEEIRAEARKAV